MLLSVSALIIANGCTGGTDGDSSVSPTVVPADSVAPVSNNELGDANLASTIAAVAAPPGIFDEERARGIDALNLRASLGADVDAILSLLASSEDSARAMAPAFPWPATDQPAAAAPSGFLSTRSVLRVGAPPPDAEIRDVLPGALDNVGRGNGAVHQGPDVSTSNETAEGRTATTTMTTTWDGNIQGSVVTLTVRRDVHSVIAGANGSTVLDKTDKYVVSVQLDVCPTGDGLVVGTVDHDNSQEATVTAGPGGSSAHASSTLIAASKFQGTVDDEANLGNVTQDYTHDEHWMRSGSDDADNVDDGTFTLTATGVGDGVPAARDWSIAIGDWSNSITPESISMSDDVSLPTSLTHAMVTAALDYNTIDQAYLEAQRLWRHGRCVMVAAPDYGAQTPLEASQQQSVQHTEEVDTSSTTTFEAALKHRFGGTVTATINADLTGGKETLTPGAIAQPPGNLDYEAPAEDDQTATVLLVSTSKQGIGRLLLEFHTKVPGWTFNGDTPLGQVRGLKCDGIGGEWLIRGEGAIGPMILQSTRTIVIDAATLSGTSNFTETLGSGVVQSTTTSTAPATIVINADGSITMHIDAGPTVLSTTNSFGGAGSVTIPGQALTFPWQQADAEACP